MGDRSLALARWAGILAGIATIWFAVDRWLWYRSLPRYARICGNCFLGSVGVAFELALLDVVLAVACLLRLRPRREDVLWWGHAVLGILATPFLIGVPLFAGSWLMLAASLAQRGGAKLNRLFW